MEVVMVVVEAMEDLVVEDLALGDLVVVVVEVMVDLEGETVEVVMVDSEVETAEEVMVDLEVETAEEVIVDLEETVEVVDIMEELETRATLIGAIMVAVTVEEEAATVLSSALLIY